MKRIVTIILVMCLIMAHIGITASAEDITQPTTDITQDTLTAPKIKERSASETSILIGYEPVSRAQGYEFYMKKYGRWEMTDTFRKSSYNYIGYGGLDSNTTYSIGIRAYYYSERNEKIISSMTVCKIRTLRKTALKKMKTKTKVDACQVKRSGSYFKSYGIDVAKMINRERAKKGLKPLKWDETLYKCAQRRCKEISVKYAHVRPDGSSCGTICEAYHGENIVAGHNTPIGAHLSWVNSKGHYENVVRPEFTRVAVAAFRYNGYIYWVTGFGY